MASKDFRATNVSYCWSERKPIDITLILSASDGLDMFLEFQSQTATVNINYNVQEVSWKLLKYLQ